jgi:peptidoglycan/xylan/chitin deacetylase (PgdA/CDA1 family)
VKRNFEIVLILLVLLIGFVQIDAEEGRQIAITVDDLPFVTMGGGTKDVEPIKQWTTKLLAKFKKYRAPAIGFVNAGKLFLDSKEVAQNTALLSMWLDAGFELGNHSFGHKDFHRVPWQEFRDDVVSGERVIMGLLKQRGQTLRFFRHPLLHTGNNMEKKNTLAAFLADRGYRVAPVTVDNSEWIYARAYHYAIEAGNKKQMKQIVDSYIPYMEQKLQYFENQSKLLLGYEIKQILLLHANELNADHFDKLAEMMEKRGYEFISIYDALKDKAYTSKDSYIGNAGISWIHRWALSQGEKGSFFKGEPEAPEFIKKLAGINYE